MNGVNGFRRMSPDGPGDPGNTYVRETPKKPEARRMPSDGPGDPGGQWYETAPKGSRRVEVRMPPDGPGDPGGTYVTFKPYERRDADDSDSIRG